MPLKRRLIAQTIHKNGPTKAKMARTIKLELPKRANIIGNVLVCGQGDMGQLGLGNDDAFLERKRPALVQNIENAIEVVAGGMHNLVLSADGKVFSFGCNDEGALGRDCSEEGSDFVPASIDLPGKVLKISAGDSHSACLLEDGRAFAWGSFRDSHGNMGLTLEGNKRTPVNVLPDIKCCAIASGSDHLVMLSVTGQVYTVGCGEQGQLGRVSLRAASGEGRRGKTQLLCPGEVIVKGRKRIAEIWATNYCTFLREQNDDTIWAFGLNNYQQLIYNKPVQVVISPINTKIENVKKIAGGQHHTIVLKQDGTCYVLGRCDYGRLGLGTIKEDVKELTQVIALADKKVVQVSCGETQTFALTDDGKLYAWGMGSNQQLGTGSEDDAWSPVLIESKQTQGKYLLNVDSGGQHSIFLVTDRSPNADDAGTGINEVSTTTIEPIGKKKAAAVAERKEANKVGKTTTTVNEIENTPSVITNGNKDDVNVDSQQSDEVKSNGKAEIGKRGRKKID